MVAALLDAVLLPKQVAICKCQAHTNNDDFVSQGTARADAAAKAAAQLDNTNNNIQCLAIVNSPLTSTVDLFDLQARASPEERVAWKKAGCSFSDKVWYGPNGRPCLPKYLFPHYAKLTHGGSCVQRGNDE